jgi:hypothetical protein
MIPLFLFLLSPAPSKESPPPGPTPVHNEPYQSVCNKGHIVVLQDGLRRRMDKLKSSIEEANQAVDRERQKNVSLLHLIFPPDIAKRLWLGQYSHCSSVTATRIPSLHHVPTFLLDSSIKFRD